MAADRLRPHAPFDSEDKLRWLAQADALLRVQVAEKSAGGAFDEVGADRTGERPEEDCELLAPRPFEGMYVHYLCAQMDAALGEADRAANELAQYNTLRAAFAAWARQSYPPAKQERLRW